MNPINPFSDRQFSTPPFQGKKPQGSNNNASPNFKPLKFRPYFDAQQGLPESLPAHLQVNSMQDRFEKMSTAAPAEPPHPQIQPQKTENAPSPFFKSLWPAQQAEGKTVQNIDKTPDKNIAALENRNLLFSSNSIRAQLDYFIRNPKSERLVLPFSKNAEGWEFGQTKLANILIKKNTLTPPANTNQTDSEKMTSWYIQPLYLEKAENTHRELPALLRKMNLPQGQALHFAWQPKSNTLLSEQDFSRQGITEQDISPLENYLQTMLENVIRFLKPILPFVSINHENKPQIGNQLVVKSAVRYTDYQGVPYQHLELIKTGDEWYQIKSAGEIQPLITSHKEGDLDKRQRRKLLDNLMAEVSKIEASCYQADASGHIILKSDDIKSAPSHQSQAVASQNQADKTKPSEAKTIDYSFPQLMQQAKENSSAEKIASVKRQNTEASHLTQTLAIQLPSGLRGIQSENPFMLTTPVFKAEVLNENKTAQTSTPQTIQGVIELNDMVAHQIVDVTAV